jgi:hypothetical protein
VTGWLRRVARRRERVVPVVSRATRRRWLRYAAEPAADPAATLHLLYLRYRDRFLPRYFAKFHAYPVPRNRFARAWRWYLSDVLIQSLRLLRRNGRLVRGSAGVPLGRQLRELVRLSVSLPSMPENYYKFGWYLPERRASAGDYLHRHETKGALYEMLATRPDLARVAPLNDKVGFADHATAAGLPVVPTLAIVENGEVVRAAADPVAGELFAKPLAGKGGRGAERWDSLTGLVERAGGRSLLVQPRLVNHPELADLALDALATCRLITITDEAGEPEPVIATFRMPAVAGVIVDNMHRGGLAAPVEIATGVLGAGSGYAVGDPVTRHPVSGGPIEGRKLPLWDEVLALAGRAHRAFAPRLLVGWDIAIGPAGPVLVEGNEQPGVDGLQRLHQLPLGPHRFGQLLAFHLGQRFEVPRRW